MHGEEGSDEVLCILPAKVDGVILTDHCVDDGYVLDLHRRHIPFVLLGREVEGTQVNANLPSSYRGAYEAVTHLIQHGYGQVAFIGGPRGSIHSKDRYRGHRQALQDHDAVRGEFKEDGGRQAMLQLLDLSEPPRAVFAANDLMAIGALDAVRGRGLRVPDDIAVIGFDDIKLASYMEPPLTTVRQAIHELGVLAVQVLLRCIKDPSVEAESTMLPTELVIRGSCGCGDN